MQTPFLLSSPACQTMTPFDEWFSLYNTLILMSREMTLTSMYNSDMTVYMVSPSSSEWTVRAGEWLLSCVNSQVSTRLCFVSCPAVADLTHVPGTVSLSVRIKTLHRSQRQLTERALCCRAAAVSGSCIWRDHKKSMFHTIGPGISKTREQHRIIRKETR